MTYEELFQSIFPTKEDRAKYEAYKKEFDKQQAMYPWRYVRHLKPKRHKIGGYNAN